MTDIKHFFTKSAGIGGKIKHRYSDFIVEEILEKRICEVKRFVKSKELTKDEQLAVPENKEKLEYLHVNLEKINRDLHDAIRQISRFLHCSTNRIGYAGIKDKRAITCQRISIWKPDVERLKSFRSNSIALREAEWHSTAIDLGMLKGNRFTVTIRNIELEEEEIKKRVQSCFEEMEKGIGNYFGAQRFGGIRKVSHLVGKEIIKGNYENAVMLYLSAVAPEESEEVKNARALAAQHEFKKALNAFPIKYRYERMMLHHLATRNNDFIGALRKLPRKILFLFTHAYQAYLFNELINKRIEHGIGLNPVKNEPSEDGIALGLLPGYDSKFSPGIIGTLERELLKEHGITFADFKVKVLKECSSAGSRRKIVMFPKDMELLEIADDEFFEGKKFCTIRFTLEKGCYATIVLREITKQSRVC
ncbi:MAG: tRNA pseudouridine(13) synthase TruD [Candidatus Diapherotrites archaeon]|nr:tRNA pseudouridine(13) synthase TruD [Candidatus Diapherotrites archaeon]